jgi:hypothetical protein
MVYRGPGFLAVVRGGAKSYDDKKAWSSIIIQYSLATTIALYRTHAQQWSIVS